MEKLLELLEQDCTMPVSAHKHPLLRKCYYFVAFQLAICYYIVAYIF